MNVNEAASDKNTKGHDKKWSWCKVMSDDVSYDNNEEK